MPSVGQHFASRTDALFEVIADRHGHGVTLVPRAHTRQALARAGVTFRDAAPQNNLGRAGQPGFLPGSWATKQAQDSDPGTSQGTQGSAAGSRRRLPPSPTPSALRRGAFTVSDLRGGIDTGGKMPSTHYAPSLVEEDGRNPSVDDEEPDTLGETVGTLPDPGPGMVYVLEPQPDGSVDVCVVPDDGSDMTTNDRVRKHRISDGVDPVLRRMNAINRRRSTRDWQSEIKRTLYRYPATKRNARLTLEPNIQDQCWDLVLWTIADPARYGTPTTGQQDRPGTVWPATSWNAQMPERGAPPGERSIHELDARITSDRGLTEPQKLRLMQAANSQFWRKRA